MKYTVDDATLERINRRVAERLRAPPMNSISRAAAISTTENDDDSARALRAEIAELLSNFGPDDLGNALSAAMKKVLGEDDMFQRTWAKDATSAEQIASKGN